MSSSDFPSRVIRCLGAQDGSLQLVERLGNERADRVTWAARSDELGEVVVKARYRDRAPEKTRWCATTLPLLGARGYPVPEYLWHGALDQSWYLAVQRRLPGSPVIALDPGLIDELTSLVELQADASVAPAHHDMAAYHALVLFEGWDHVWRDAEMASAEARDVCERIRLVLRPVWGHRLVGDDFAHGDLNLSNVLHDGTHITGVVDWDHFGLNSRAADLTSILFDWLRLHGETSIVLDSESRRLLDRIATIAGEPGLRCVVAYAAVGRLASAQRRGDDDMLASWITVTDRLFEAIT